MCVKVWGGEERYTDERVFVLTSAGKLLILSLLTSVSVVVLLLIGAGVAPQSKR